MLFGQFSGSNSLRAIETGLSSHRARLYHVGGKPVARATLADANARRPAALFAEMFSHMATRAGRPTRRHMRDAIRLIDATHIKLTSLSNGWADMIRDLHPGDVVRVLYVRDLGGSPVADRVWRERIKAKGATVEEVRPEKPVAVMGRPRKFDPSPEQEARVREAWLDEARSLADREQAVADIMGERVTRFALYKRIGKPGAPK